MRIFLDYKAPQFVYVRSTDRPICMQTMVQSHHFQERHSQLVVQFFLHSIQQNRRHTDGSKVLGSEKSSLQPIFGVKITLRLF